MILPKSKNENIIVQQLPKEMLIYDKNINKAYSLNETSAKVFIHCDGATDSEILKEKYQFSEEIILLALDGLKKENLLEEDSISPLAGESRREVIKKIGLTSMIALPVISSLIAPGAASAASLLGTNAVCFSASECESGVCTPQFTPGTPILIPGPPMMMPGPPIIMPGGPGMPPMMMPGTPITIPGTPVSVPGVPIPTGVSLCQ